jgi:hypothetical protein
MGIAWTTLLIIALLSPGVFFFIGYGTHRRYAREIVRSGALGEVGAAFLIAIFIHLSVWAILSIFGFDLTANIKQFADYEHIDRPLLIDHIFRRIPYIGLYIIGTSILGLLLGLVFALAILKGLLPFLATHKWINDVMGSMRKGLVSAYVMTKVEQNNRVLMYKGVLAEFYLSPEGKFIYIVLKTCSRYYMKFEDDAPTTSRQLQLFSSQSGRQDRTWEYLLIDGENVANILFDPSPQIVETTEGTDALTRALEDLRREVSVESSNSSASPH